MKHQTLALLTALTTLLCSGSTLAQPRDMGRSGGWGVNAPYQRLYNPSTVETIKGTVVKIEQWTPERGMNKGVHLILNTDKGEIPVHLGPAWFLDKQDTKINTKDKVEIRGSRVDYQGKPAIIAAEVKKNDEVLKLRDDTGTPVWAGWRRGQ
jgi:hypothetical protein